VEHNWTHKYGLLELPYMMSLILMHNIDVMHQERNVVKNLVNTCMSLEKKQRTKRKPKET
jgi:23S rRNA maturation-related 3'-5' exoribonuclease YhaM